MKQKNIRRRDNKNRILKTGESQRANGQYEFAYTLPNGTRKHVYSWKLEETDALPAGKRSCHALRSLEDEIRLDELMDIQRTDYTLNEIFDISIASWGKAIQTTRDDYKNQYDRYVRSSIGTCLIRSVDEEAIDKLNRALFDKGLSFSTVQRVDAIVGRALSYAVSKKLIRNNPMDNVVVKDISDDADEDTQDVQPLSHSQVIDLLDFVRHSKMFNYWYELIVFLLETGLRIGEAAGLRWSDINWDAGEISVRHALKLNKNPKGRGKILTYGSVKSEASKRRVPMSASVVQLLEQVMEKQKNMDIYGKVTFGNQKGFVFFNKANHVLNRDNVATVMRRIRKAYNDREDKQAALENREAKSMPPIHPHVFRHTCCTRLCEVESNPARVKEIMGHSSINITLKVYAEISREAKQEAVRKVESKFGTLYKKVM